MKRAILLLFAGTLTFAACIKNNTTPACQDVDPATELSGMQAFALTQGMTPSVDTFGIVYDIKNLGETPLVSSGYDTIKIKYEGKLLNGTTFDKSDSLGLFYNGKPVYAGSFIKGFYASLIKIGKGGHIKVVIPSYAAYGCNGSGTKIPANSPLYFDITLLDLKKAQ